jgi:hypothetical protein
MSAFEWIVFVGALVLAVIPQSLDPAIRLLDWIDHKRRNG